jgi:hypothetical protein
VVEFPKKKWRALGDSRLAVPILGRIQLAAYLFPSDLCGRCRKGATSTAVVYHDHDDIKNSLAEFYALLTGDNVLSGSLVEPFEDIEKTTTQLFANDKLHS